MYSAINPTTLPLQWHQTCTHSSSQYQNRLLLGHCKPETGPTLHVRLYAPRHAPGFPARAGGDHHEIIENATFQRFIIISNSFCSSSPSIGSPSELIAPAAIRCVTRAIETAIPCKLFSFSRLKLGGRPSAWRQRPASVPTAVDFRI
jgi:hypothetical protein